VLLVKTHGSLNEIFAAEARPESFGSDAELRAFVRRVCDRQAWTGGSDGVYLFDASTPDTQAWFFNPDGSSAEFCGNGMRGLGRLILDQRGTDTEVVASGGRQYTIRRASSTPEGVRQVQLELPEISFAPAPSGPFHGYTAVTVPNPHVISIVASYSEPDLIEAGQRAADWFPEGANVSFLLPLDSVHPDDTAGSSDTASSSDTAHDGAAVPEVFVRTFERGAGLTPSCGSGVVASRAAYSRITGLDPSRPVLVRNAGGVATAMIGVRGSSGEHGAWFPVLEGNATVVYRAEADHAGNQASDLAWDAAENNAYATLDECNTAYLKSAGVTTAHP
jgi:diaminopimelate epimerase